MSATIATAVSPGHDATRHSPKEPLAPALDEARLAPAYAVVEREIAADRIPGAVLAVARDHGPVVTRAFGQARWTPEAVPARADTIFSIASISKPIVTTAVLQQVDQGRLLLDDPVVRHIPEFGAQAKEGITVRHLLTHTSGLDEGWVMQHLRDDRPRASTWEGQVSTICEAPLAFPPGSLYRYTNPSFTILGELVRRHSGLGIEAYLAAHVLGPLGMADTSFFPPPAVDARRASVAPANWPEGRAEQPGAMGAWAEALHVPRPSGGLRSTAGDLIAFGRACLHTFHGRRFMGRRLLSQAVLRAALRPQAAGLMQVQDGVEQPAPSRGLGFALLGRPPLDLLSSAAFGHGGSTGTLLAIDPEQDLVVVFLTNRLGWDGHGRHLAVNAAVAGASAP